jgi:glycosyltransferase involved in cell wall biosynthesis
MASRLLIVSLKYSPGLWKEFSLIGALAAANGYEVCYFVAPEYQEMGDLPQQVFASHSKTKFDIAIQTLRAVTFSDDLDRIISLQPTKVLLYNFHPANLILIDRIRRAQPKAEIAIFVHDPLRDKAAFRIAERLYYLTAEWLEGLTVGRADRVIVASRHGRHLLNQRFGGVRAACDTVRLLVPDVGEAPVTGREFVTMLGHCNSATGHDVFFDLLENSSKSRSEFKFVLLTSSEIRKSLSALSRKAKARLLVVNRPVILDDEINHIIRRSYAVLRLDRQLAQSGVIPVSYMNGASVIVRDIPGLRQDVEHKQTGLLLPADFDSGDILTAIEEIISNFPSYSKAARRAFEARWSAKSFASYYGWLQ